MKDLGFVEFKNTHLILFSAVFLVLGFLLGRVTGHQGPLGCMEVDDNVWVSNSQVEVMESMTGGQDVQIIRKETGDGEVVVRDEKNDFP